MPQKKTEIETPPAAKGRNSPDSKGVNEEHTPVSEVEEKSKCHIHDKVEEWEVEDIRETVCVNDEPLTEFEGRHYCLFHLPTKEKKIAKFDQIFQARLIAVKEKLAEIEELPEVKREAAKNKVRYDFRYVWFPSQVYLYEFSAVANFRSATFSANAYFNSATFSAHADFSSATFSDAAWFSSATFSVDADFSWAKFEELSQIFFSNTRFCSLVIFYQTVFEGYVEFENNVFLDKERIQEVEKELKTKFEELKQELAESKIEFNMPTDFIKDNQEAVLDLQKARLKNPERISFNSVCLRPGWFVNVDSRTFVFNDVTWQNIEIDVDRKGLDEELKSLEERQIKTPDEALIKACNQLGENAETNRRFEEAKKFRKQGIALKKHECHIHGAVDTSEKDDIRQKVCQEFPVVNEDGGNHYCLLHNPDKTKAEVFLKEFTKLKEAKHSDFRAVNFPISVKYQDKLPETLDFTNATFQRRVVFENANIHNLKFNEAYFDEDSELLFNNSDCDGKISFEKAVFDGKFFLNGKEKYKFFKTSDNALQLNDARFDKPNLVNFRSVSMRPHYFVGVDASKFVFLDCNWKDENGKELDIKKEIENCSHKALAQTCNQLAINYEESRNFEDSSYFRSTAMEAKKREYKFQGIFWTLNFWYKWTSGYGESASWAALMLAGLLIFFGLLYACPISTFDYGEKKEQAIAPQDAVEKDIYKMAETGERFRYMNLGEGIIYSVYVAALQRPEPKSADTLTKLFVILETIFAPLQTALLALAIRRKFMR